MTNRTTVRQTRGTYAPFSWSTGEDDILLWGTLEDDILLYSIFEDTDWTLDDIDILEFTTLETDNNLVIQDSNGDDIIFNTGIVSKSTARETFTY